MRQLFASDMNCIFVHIFTRLRASFISLRVLWREALIGVVALVALAGVEELEVERDSVFLSLMKKSS
jgi:hypothetical protein